VDDAQHDGLKEARCLLPRLGKNHRRRAGAGDPSASAHLDRAWWAPAAPMARVR